MNDTITEINKDTFWGLIRETKDACGQDMSAMVEYLKGRLVSIGAEQAQNFHDITQAYEDLAYKYGLWDAAEIITEYGCSDDGFINFRAWLIAQGKEVYLAALADPDSLAEVEPYGDCSFEQMSYVGEYAYKQLTGKSTYEQTDQREYKKLVAELKQDITYKDGIQFPREGAELKQFLPRLCAKYPDRWLEPHWNLDLKVVRELFYAGTVHDHQKQVCEKKNRSHGGEAR